MLGIETFVYKAQLTEVVGNCVIYCFNFLLKDSIKDRFNVIKICVKM